MQAQYIEGELSTHQPIESGRWLKQFRNAALLSLDEQIECCDALLDIWISSRNFASAESCARISTDLKTRKFGYNSLEVAQTMSKLVDIHVKQGDRDLAKSRAAQRDAIVSKLKILLRIEKDDLPESTKEQTRRGSKHQTRFFEDYFSSLSITDYLYEPLHESALHEVMRSAREAIDKLFAA